MHLKKSDTVEVSTGKDKGKRGRVLTVDPGRNRAVVEGVGYVKRHTKPNPQKNIKGGIVERESSVHASNLMVVCGECGKATRVGNKFLEDGSKVRVCRKCSGILDKAKA
ncbi:MAG: 50S ribosomal protein L24 [Acidobacteria bacterium]|nr:50S ribosomal protein L24 [Acidobacteriota bacterium]